MSDIARAKAWLEHNGFAIGADTVDPEDFAAYAAAETTRLQEEVERLTGPKVVNPMPTWCGKPAIRGEGMSAICGDRTCPECYFVGHHDLLLQKIL